MVKEGATKVGGIARLGTAKTREVIRNGVLSAQLRMSAVDPKARGNGVAVSVSVSVSGRVPSNKDIATKNGLTNPELIQKAGEKAFARIGGKGPVIGIPIPQIY